MCLSLCLGLSLLQIMFQMLQQVRQMTCQLPLCPLQPRWKETATTLTHLFGKAGKLKEIVLEIK